MAFVNLGTRNKGTFWEYLSAYSFLTTQHPSTAFAVDSFFAFAEGMPNKHHHAEEAIDGYINNLFWKEFRAGMYTEKFFSQLADVYLSNMRRLNKTLTGKNLKKCSSEELADLCLVATICGSSTLKPMLQGMLMMYLAPEFGKRLRAVLTKSEREDPSYVLETATLLLTIPKENFLDKEELCLRKIEEDFWKINRTSADKVLSGFIKQPKVTARIENLVRDFGWFHMEYMQEPFTAKEYEMEILRRIRIGENNAPLPRAVKQEIRKKQKAFLATHKKSKELQELVRVIHGFSYIYEESKVVLVRDNFLMRPLLEEAARRLSISWSDILYLVPPEIVSLLRSGKKANKTLIKSRFEHRAVLLRGGLITYYEGEAAVRVAQELLPEEKEENLRESVKGIIAFPGIVRGRVKVIKTGKDIFIPGDILVTHDGTAELTLFLRQASAIVTNEGGMICHCSIIAREMKTPCIVGTKNATRVFKDGDMVEVDAIKGIVKKI